VLHHPPAAVWSALTDPERLPTWAPFRPDRDLSTTGPARFTQTDGDVSDVADAEVLRAEPPALLEYEWGGDLLRWELTAVDAGTRLVLRHAVQGPEWASRVAAGWHLCLAQCDRLLAGDAVEHVTGSAAADHGWEDLERRYAAAFGLPSAGMPDQVARRD
jgi:uncharacterized protein YndB with AHSA1/START domain